jgi:hypothetical protein
MSKSQSLLDSLKKESIQELIKLVLRYIISTLPLWGTWFLDELSIILFPKLAVVLILILLSILLLFLSYFISSRKNYKKDKSELIDRHESEKKKLIKDQKLENSKLSSQLKDYKNKLSEIENNPLKDYQFDERRGIYTDEMKNYYCPSCLRKNIKLPMKVQDNGWICLNDEHGEFYPNPDYKSPPTPRSPRRTSWLDDY